MRNLILSWYILNNLKAFVFLSNEVLRKKPNRNMASCVGVVPGCVAIATRKISLYLKTVRLLVIHYIIFSMKELNFALNLVLGFLRKIFNKKFGGQILNLQPVFFSREILIWVFFEPKRIPLPVSLGILEFTWVFEFTCVCFVESSTGWSHPVTALTSL